MKPQNYLLLEVLAVVRLRHRFDIPLIQPRSADGWHTIKSIYMFYYSRKCSIVSSQPPLERAARRASPHFEAIFR